MKTQFEIDKPLVINIDTKRVRKLGTEPPTVHDPLHSIQGINFPDPPESHTAEAYGKMRMPELFRTIFMSRLERVIAKLAIGGQVSEKDEEFLNTLLEFCTENLERKTPIYGAWQGKIMMAADFDAPVEGFEEYFA